MSTQEKNKSGFDIFYSFDYKGYEDKTYDYDIPFDIFCDAIRDWFDKKNVTIDGTDNAIWNALNDLDDGNNDIFDVVNDDEQDYLRAKCKDLAYEEFKDIAEETIEADQ
jgi:hypothetical protein